MDAKKHPIPREEAAGILKQVSKVYVAKGKNVLEFNMKSADFDEVLAVALGPTGNLRAPAFRKGKTLVIGFEESAYRKVLG